MDFLKKKFVFTSYCMISLVFVYVCNRKLEKIVLMKKNRGNVIMFVF